MTKPLSLSSVIGFAGQVPEGLLCLDGQTLVYALGSTIVLRDKDDARMQEFLQGHTDKVSCLALSPSGRYLASGQVTFMGFVADVIVWDLPERRLLHRMSLHKVKVQALDFSPDEATLVSLGGPDDNNLVLWDLASGQPICGSPAHKQNVECVKFFKRDPTKIITAGNSNLQVWEHDAANNKLRPSETQLGHLQRNFKSVAVDDTDSFAYCGTTSGDVLQVALERNLLRNTGPGKSAVPQGVTAACMAPNGELIVGGGDGSLCLMTTALEPSKANPKQPKKLGLRGTVRLEGGVTSITVSMVARGTFTLHVGTSACNMYKVNVDPAASKLEFELVQTAHSEKVSDLAFPAGYGEVFATASVGCIRVWHLLTCRELLRINVPNLTCNCVIFAPDGKSIISGWSDGKVRAFGPQSGTLLYTINDAHLKGVTALAATSDSSRVISGGEEGMVRVWRISKSSQVMEASMKDHKGPVNSIAIKSTADDECVSASSDGSAIIWDLATGKRRASLFANTFFQGVAYYPDDSQLVTVGSDRKLSYWDAYDGKAIRIIDGSESAPLHSVAVDAAGSCIVTGGADKLVRVWGYDMGQCEYVGVAHSGCVTRAQVTPEGNRIVSVGSEGGIFIWEHEGVQQAQ